MQRENPPGVRRSPRNHDNSVRLIPIRAAYNIPIPKQSQPKQPIIPRTSDQILDTVINQLKSTLNLNPKTPKQHALNELLTWDQKAFDTFLYPQKQKVTHANFVCDHRPLKSEPWRVRCVLGGDKLSYSEDASSPAASMLDTKLTVQSVISDASKGA